MWRDAAFALILAENGCDLRFYARVVGDSDVVFKWPERDTGYNQEYAIAVALGGAYMMVKNADTASRVRLDDEITLKAFIARQYQLASAGWELTKFLGGTTPRTFDEFDKAVRRLIEKEWRSLSICSFFRQACADVRVNLEVRQCIGSSDLENICMEAKKEPYPYDTTSQREHYDLLRLRGIIPPEPL